MKQGKVLVILTAVGLSILVSSCAHLQDPVAAEGRENVVQMTASDFKFEPNNITARAGDAITFKIQNVSGTAHNFTLKSPDGLTMQSVGLPPKGSVDVKATFPKVGTYKFYCNKTGHSELGMKGQVVATGD